ncbi:MAG: hypothetical protein AAF664_17855 [Planctomycetota bacterium]
MSYESDPEREILSSTQAGRESLRVLRRTLDRQSGQARIAKAFELTKMSREVMRAGLRHDHPNAPEGEIAELEFEQMMRIHSLPKRLAEEVRERRRRWLESLGQSDP